jgi:hypothetical protein
MSKFKDFLRDSLSQACPLLQMSDVYILRWAYANIEGPEWIRNVLQPCLEIFIHRPPRLHSRFDRPGCLTSSVPPHVSGGIFPITAALSDRGGVRPQELPRSSGDQGHSLSTQHMPRVGYHTTITVAFSCATVFRGGAAVLRTGDLD